MTEEKYQVIVPERIYIVTGLKEAGKVLTKYPGMGVCIKLVKEELS